jgi:hypothetical protein
MSTYANTKAGNEKVEALFYWLALLHFENAFSAIYKLFLFADFYLRMRRQLHGAFAVNRHGSNSWRRVCHGHG